MLNGYKTYIFAGLIAVASGAKYLGYIDENTYQVIVGFLGAGSVASIRSGIKAAA